MGELIEVTDQVNKTANAFCNAAKTIQQGGLVTEERRAQLSKDKDRLVKQGKGGELIKETFNQANKAGIDATYTMQVLLITGFSLDDIRKYGEPVAKDADFSLRNIMETRSSAQYMVEQQILGMVLTRKFEEFGFKRDLLSPIAGFA